ncbi:fibroblast growth factor receptor 3-like isoform X2 [Halichondria panicea]
MEMLSSIGPHKNIVSMLRVYTVGKPMYMVMEYMCHGDLLGFLKTSRGHSGRYTGAKIANGMRYLADRKLVHRTLYAKNVLVGANMSIKIYNVGCFDMTFESRNYIMKWLAPETLFDQTATTYRGHTYIVTSLLRSLSFFCSLSHRYELEEQRKKE